MKTFIAVCGLLLIPSPLYLSWVLARLGIYKRWYLAYSIPPIIWKGAIFMWPAGTVFFCAPLAGSLPLKPEDRLSVLAVVSVLSIVLAIIMAIWTPRWAKPKWQRYLEDHYSHEEIQTFIPVWREMDPQKWSELLDSEKGIEELVAIARAAHQAQQ